MHPLPDNHGAAHRRSQVNELDGLDDIVSEFLLESNENLDQLDQDLVALESDPTSKELLGRIFRSIHTVKGTSGFLGLHRLEKVAHAGENLLAKLRDGDLVLHAGLSDLLLQTVDIMRAILTGLEATNAEPQGDDSTLLADLTAACAGESPAPPAGELPTQRTRENADEVAPVTAADPAPEAPVTDRAPEAPAAEAGHDGRRSVSESSVRVDITVLDQLMTLVGELVLTRNQVLQQTGSKRDAAVGRTLGRLDQLTADLQDAVLKTRMQPIEHVWSKVPRVVRDLARQLNKDVAVHLHGGETELDRAVLESVKDPLTHLVRNAIDHGIENPDDRVAAGKPRQGNLTLRAYHDAGQVTVEITDDGNGIDPEVVRARALERGLIDARTAASMTRDQLIDLVFAPGFSTAAAVTNVSGRGVGMDVVRSNIQQIGGSVDISSTVGKGSSFRITIPLTLAIIPTLAVTSMDEVYAIPQASLVELVRLDPAHTASRVENVSGSPVFRLRGRLLPLLDLRDVLGEPARPADQPTSIAVLVSDGQQLGLVVDRVSAIEDTVVKPLGAHLRDLPVYSGAAVMGDGGVSLILDVAALAARAGMTSRAGSTDTEEETFEGDTLERLLLLSTSNGGQVALPLSAVDRLEEIAADRLERIGGHEVVQYRDRILPLVRLVDSLLGASGPTWGAEEDPNKPLTVVVCTRDGHLIGLVAEQVLDIVHAELSIRSPLDSSGRLGSAVISGRVTELVDLDPIIGPMASLLGAHAAAGV
jgi:two-component system chemotaxis sensor kinase CheA